jgi:hypothetical protein
LIEHIHGTQKTKTKDIQKLRNIKGNFSKVNSLKDIKLFTDYSFSLERFGGKENRPLTSVVAQNTYTRTQDGHEKQTTKVTQHKGGNTLKTQTFSSLSSNELPKSGW